MTDHAAPAAIDPVAAAAQPHPNQFALLRQRRFAPFFWTQFAGAANDTLDSPEVGPALAAAGITFCPDFVANAGGVVQVHAENTGMTHDELVDAVEAIEARTARVLATAAERGVTPVEAAEALARERLAAHAS